MEPVDFCYWLQGLISTVNNDTISGDNITLIKRKLSTVLAQVEHPNTVTVSSPEVGAVVYKFIPDANTAKSQLYSNLRKHR